MDIRKTAALLLIAALLLGMSGCASSPQTSEPAASAISFGLRVGSSNRV